MNHIPHYDEPHSCDGMYALFHIHVTDNAVSPAFTHTGIPLLSLGSVFDKATISHCTTPSIYAQLKVTISAHHQHNYM